MLNGQSSDNRLKIDSLESLLNDRKALDIARVDMLNELGFEYWIIDPAKSEKFGSEALEIAKILPYEKGKAFANRVIGVSHWVRGNADLSFKFLLEAEDLYRAISDTLGLANSILNLGMSYTDQQNYATALNKYELALSYFDQLEEDSRIATTFTKIADLFIRQQKYEEAYQYLIQALEIHQSNEFTYGIAEANGKLGKISLARSDYNNSISYFLLAVEAGNQRNDHVGMSEYFHGIALAYYKKEDFKQAQTYLDASLELAETFKLKPILKDIYDLGKKLSFERGNYKDAVHWSEKYIEVKDQLFNEEKSNIISNMEARRAYLEKGQQLEIAQKNLDLLIQKNKIDNLKKLALILGLVALCAMLWALLQRKSRRLLRKQEDLIKAKNKTTQLEDTIQTKEQELTSYTFNFVQKNQLIAELKESLKTLKLEVGATNKSKVEALSRKIESTLRIDEDWNDFRKHFENVHPKLIQKLNLTYPDLTKNEFKLIALIRLNLTSKEISSILGISPDSVKTARYRLRKKLKLDNQIDLFDFLINFQPATQNP